MKKLSSKALARKAGELALSKKGFDVRILKLKDISSVCDFFVIISGDADIHNKAIGYAIVDGLRDNELKPYHIEGLEEGNWILLDYINVVIHIFREPIRKFYSLEKLWGDAPVEILKDE